MAGYGRLSYMSQSAIVSVHIVLYAIWQQLINTHKG